MFLHPLADFAQDLHLSLGSKFCSHGLVCKVVALPDHQGAHNLCISAGDACVREVRQYAVFHAIYGIESPRRLSPHVTAPLLIQKLRCLLEPDCMLSRSMG